MPPGVLESLPVGSRAELGGPRAQRGIPVNRCRPKCAENLVKHNENEQSKMAHNGLWGEYFGSQVVPVEGDKGGCNPPPGKGEGEMSLLF